MRWVLIISAGLFWVGCSQQGGAGGDLGLGRGELMPAQERSVQSYRQSVMSEEEMVPYSDVMSYPDDWVEIARKRQ